MDPITPQPQESQYQAPIEHKHFLNKKFIVTFVILALLGSGAYAGIWYWGNQQVAQEVAPTFTPRPSALPDPTAGWKTYTNTKYTLTLKYPNSFNIVQDSSNFFSAKDALLWMVLQINNPGSGGIQIYNPITKTVTLNGTAVSYQIGKVLEMGSSTPSTERAWVGSFSQGGNSFYFTFRASDGTDRTQLVDQMLSTFKFTDSTGSPQADSADTSTWKTYTNMGLGVSVQYPPDWVVEASNPENSLTPSVKIYSAKNPPSMGIIGESFTISIDTRTDIEQIRGLYNGSGRYQEQITTMGSQKTYQYKDVSIKSLTMYTPYKGKIYTINAAPFDNSLISKALSTFKFTK